MVDVDNKKAYYAVIPGKVRYDKKICDKSKLMYGEISALCNELGFCWASNEYFAVLYGVHKNTVSKWISQLKNQGYIYIEVKRGAHGYERKIYIIDNPLNEKLKGYQRKAEGGINENVNTPKRKAEDNITYNNTINNTYNERFENLKNLFHVKYQKYHNSKITNWQKETVQLKNILKQDDKIISEKLEIFESHIVNSKNEFWKSVTFLPSTFYSMWDRLVKKAKKEITEADIKAYKKEKWGK